MSCDPATEHEALNDVQQQCYDLDAETLALYSASWSSKSAKCAITRAFYLERGKREERKMRVAQCEASDGIFSLVEKVSSV